MTDLKLIKMIDAIEEHLISKHGIAYLNLSKEKRHEMIALTFHEYMQSCRERQA